MIESTVTCISSDLFSMTNGDLGIDVKYESWVCKNPLDQPFDVQATISNLMKEHRERRGVKTSIQESTTKSISGELK
jgi:hypothetical protein